MFLFNRGDPKCEEPQHTENHRKTMILTTYLAGTLGGLGIFGDCNEISRIQQ